VLLGRAKRIIFKELGAGWKSLRLSGNKGWTGRGRKLNHIGTEWMLTPEKSLNTRSKCMWAMGRISEQTHWKMS